MCRSAVFGVGSSKGAPSRLSGKLRRWRNVRSKSDRLDAQKLAELSQVGQLPLVHVPERSTRQWRSLIAYRRGVVGRRTQIQNAIRAMLDREGLAMPAGAKGWTGESLKQLGDLARDLSEVGPEELWRGQLRIELEALAAVSINGIRMTISGSALKR